jgi:hypothetical protein
VPDTVTAMSYRQVRCLVVVALVAATCLSFASCSSSSPKSGAELVEQARRAVNQTREVRPTHLVTYGADVPPLHTMAKVVDGANDVRHLGTLGDRSCNAKVYGVTADADRLFRRLKNVEGRVWQGQVNIDGRRVRVLSEVGFDYEQHAVLIDAEGSGPQVLSVYSCG